MKKDQTIDESVNKIKFMMNYDSLKTLTEQLDPTADPTPNLGTSVEKIFKYCEDNKELLLKVPRGINDQQILEMSKTLYGTMQGADLFMTRTKEPIMTTFESLKTISDFIALNDTFNTYYGSRQNLMTWMKGEVSRSGALAQWTSIGSRKGLDWNRIQGSLLKLIYGAAKPQEKIDDKAKKNEASNTGGYKPCTGTYTFGCSSPKIAEVQTCLGLVPDGKFGNKTKAKLAELGKSSFTDADIPTLCKSAQQSSPPAEQPTAQEQPQRDINYVTPKSVPVKVPNVGTSPVQKLAEESLERMRILSNYDASMTLDENKKKVDEQLESPGGIAAKTGIGAVGATALGAKTATALYGSAAFGTGKAATAAVLVGNYVTGGAGVGAGSIASAISGTGAAAIGGAVLAGAAALALVPLILWLVDKDKAYPKTKKLFDYVKENKEKIDQVTRGLDDDTIQQLSDDLYNAMKGLGTRNKMVYRVFNSLVTISDFSALISTFNEDHLNEGSGDLLEWLDSDFDVSSMWNKIYVPLRNIVKKFAKKLAAENMPENGADSGSGSGSGGYKPVAGTNEQRYQLGTSGAGIFKVQECLGFTGADVDGKFGPKTQAKMMELAKQYVNGFTDADIDGICKLAAPQRDPQIAPITAIPTQDQTIKSQVKMPTLATPIKTTGKDALAPGPMTLSSLTPPSVAPKRQGLVGRVLNPNK